MDSLISLFHIDVRLLLAQAFNFGVIFLLLYFFIFKPLVGTMNERSGKIKASLEEAEGMAKKMEEANREQGRIISQAKKDAAGILASARSIGEDKKEEMIGRAKEKIEAVIKEEKKKMAEEKDRIIVEIKGEVGQLVADVIVKIAGSDIGAQLDKALIDKLLKSK